MLSQNVWHALHAGPTPPHRVVIYTGGRERCKLPDINQSRDIISFTVWCSFSMRETRGREGRRKAENEKERWEDRRNKEKEREREGWGGEIEKEK